MQPPSFDFRLTSWKLRCAKATPVTPVFIAYGHSKPALAVSLWSGDHKSPSIASGTSLSLGSSKQRIFGVRVAERKPRQIGWGRTRGSTCRFHYHKREGLLTALNAELEFCMSGKKNSESFLKASVLELASNAHFLARKSKVSKERWEASESDQLVTLQPAVCSLDSDCAEDECCLHFLGTSKCESKRGLHDSCKPNVSVAMATT